MKTYILRIVMMLVIAISFSEASAQVVVKIRPAAPAFKVRPARPSVTHVWVGGNYAWRGNQYYYTDGYWAAPPVPGNRWVEGRWKHRRGGWVWIPGHWR
jgi:hypothetical protein